MQRVLAGLAIAALTAVPAAAALAPKAWEAGEYSACMDRAGGVTVSMRECISAELHRRDAELNAAYRRLADVLATPDRKAALQAAQRAWIGFRDAECTADASGAVGGTIWPLIVETCHIDMTYERTLQLRDKARIESQN
ncbi:lysozyme inhibitor LprI family protein [Phenylobacterium sp. LjRoot225]|uniref:lysozyme inhibitor LprI family protein n=1 Tax=Phenylobacterium sp. LjRoot225 TaxID=3342285 RepID=UPI003ED0784A